MLIADLDLLKEVMVKHFDHFHDRPPVPDLLRKKSGLPRGLLTSRGDYWKKLRVTLSPTFSSAKMRMVIGWSWPQTRGGWTQVMTQLRRTCQCYLRSFLMEISI